jgi:hypothetical protein
MKNIDLYKFVKDNNIEYHWHDDNVIIFIPVYLIEEWMDLLGWRYLDEDGLKCWMKHKYFCFWMKDICYSFDIDMIEIFSDKNV